MKHELMMNMVNTGDLKRDFYVANACNEGNKLRARLVDAGIKQADLAKAFGKSDGYISRVISGDAIGPAADQMRKDINELLDYIERDAIDNAKLDAWEWIGDEDDF